MIVRNYKGISVAIFGFVTIGLIVAGLIWAQYNSTLGIQEKISSGEYIVIERLNEESWKMRSYIESSLGFAGVRALSAVSETGGMSGDTVGYWQCVSPSVPELSGILAAADEKALSLANAYASLLSRDDGNMIVKFNNLSCVNTKFADDDKSSVLALGNVPGYGITEGNAFMGSDGLILEKNIGLGNYWRDYTTLKSWVENEEIRHSIENKLNDAAHLPQGLSFESCSCSTAQCPDEETILANTYPCWQSGIDSAVRDGVNKAVKLLGESGQYFGNSSVTCESKVDCISIHKPVIINKKTKTYGTSLCCGVLCSGCADDPCRVKTTEKICSGSSVESVCQKPDCSQSPVRSQSCSVSLDKREMAKSSMFDVGDGNPPAETGTCESCCSVSFGLVYETDVDLSVTCTDTSSIIPSTHGFQPLKWTIRLFVASASSEGSDYRPDVDPGCLQG